MKIAFDLDGVAANFSQAFRDFILEEHDYDIWYDGRNGRTFKFTVPGVPEKKMYDYVTQVISTRDIAPFPEAMDALRVLWELTDEPIYFLTARPEKKVKDLTEDWVDKYLNVPFQVAFAGSNHKLRHLQKRGFDTFVEDRYRTANILSGGLKKVYLINRTYNMGRAVPENVERIHSLWQIVDSIPY